MKFDIIRATHEDVPELARIMEAVTAGMEKPEWFISDDMEYIAARVGHEPIACGDLGFLLKAVALVDGRERIAGFFMADFPGVGERNLGHYIGMDLDTMETVAHLDSALILPEFRGYGLQKRLLEKAEEVYVKETDYRILLCTVHPENQYSLRNVLSCGYEVSGEIIKHGIYRRYVMKKEIR